MDIFALRPNGAVGLDEDSAGATKRCGQPLFIRIDADPAIVVLAVASLDEEPTEGVVMHLNVSYISNSWENAMSNSIVTGSCFCGAVRFELELPVLFCGHCHCSMCRKAHGASFVTWTAVPPDRLKITDGELDIAVFKSSAHGSRSFCRQCGSQLFCRPDSEVVDIPLACLHGEIGLEPNAHYFYDSRADWTDVNDDLPKYGGEKGNEPLQ
jgi:hypothetical protein